MFEGFADVYDENARLAILRVLAEQNDYRLTDSMIEDLLASRYAINKGRDYIRSQIAWLQNSAGAVKNTVSGPVVICELTQAGVDHVMRKTIIPGVKRPGVART